MRQQYLDYLASSQACSCTCSLTSPEHCNSQIKGGSGKTRHNVLSSVTCCCSHLLLLGITGKGPYLSIPCVSFPHSSQGPPRQKIFTNLWVFPLFCRSFLQPELTSSVSLLFSKILSSLEKLVLSTISFLWVMFSGFPILSSAYAETICNQAISCCFSAMSLFLLSAGFRT